MTKKHMFLMLACCLIPLTALAAISVFNLPINSVLYFGVILLCPLLHFVMMRGMMGHNHHPAAEHSHHQEPFKRPPMAEKAQWVVGERDNSTH